MSVFVLDKRKKPLMPCSEKRARLLLERGRARVHRLLPFTIRLVDRTVADCVLQPLEIKLDPGSKTTGIALVRCVVATVPTGKKAGIHIGRVAVRKSGSFNIQTGGEVVQGIDRHCRMLQRGDGYGYAWLPTTREDQKPLPGFLPQPDRSASPMGSLREPDDQGRGIHRSFR